MKTEITPVKKETYHVIIRGVDIGVLHQSEVRDVIEKLDNGIN